jgi:hypothetical protein
MDEIATTFREVGLPDDFHSAAADIYRRIAHFKGADDPLMAEVIEALIQAEGRGTS